MKKRELGALLIVLAYSLTLIHLAWVALNYFGEIVVEIDATTDSLIIRNLGDREVTVESILAAGESSTVNQVVPPGGFLRLDLPEGAEHFIVVTDAGSWALAVGGKRLASNKLRTQAALAFVAFWTGLPPVALFLWEFFRGVRGVAIPYAIAYLVAFGLIELTWPRGAPFSPAISASVGTLTSLILSEAALRRHRRLVSKTESIHGD